MAFSKTKPFLMTALAASALLTACAVGNEYREITAERIARPAFMIERRIDVQGMDFGLWERMHQRGAPANVYIEGDGDSSFIGQVLQDPTPGNPVSLHLASRDNSENLLYISRPCQFRESPDHEACAPKYWQNRRFGPEVIAAYNEILDEIKRRYDITEFNLIGYDGGANIAGALAANRGDVVSLRTVAGNLNPSITYDPKKVTLDSDSYDIAKNAPSLARVPQHHFVGAGDDVIPASVYHSFRQAMGPSECVHYTFVPDADHTHGWVEKWPELLKSTIECPQEPVVVQPTVQLPSRPIEKP